MLQALCVVTSASAPGKITSVAVNKVGTGVELVVRGEGLSKPKVFPFLNGKMRVVEFAAGMNGRGGKTDVRQGAIRSYNTFWYKSTPPIVRINVRLTNSVDPVLVETDNGWKLGFGVAKEDLQAKLLTPDVKNDFPDTVPALVLTQPKAEVKVAEDKPVQPEVKKVSKEPFPETVPPLVTLNKAKATEKDPLALHAPAATSQQAVSIDFVNTDIVQVLKAIAIQSNVNIVTSPDVKGIVTVSLRNVTVDEALKIVTSLGALGYAKVGATFIVAPSDKIDAIRRSITGEAAPTLPQTQKEPDSMVSYNVKGGKAADLLKAVLGEAKDGRIGNVTLIGTPAESASLQTIVIRGPRAEAEGMLRIFEQLDNAVQPNVTTEIYDVRFSDPRSLREDLISAFPGLRASIAPSSMGNPRLYTTNEQANQVRQGFNAGPGQNGGAASNDTGTTGTTTQGNQLQTGIANLNEREQRGLTLPYSDFEAVSVPMRLVLRGTPDQIAAARAYAARVDTQPKQIALELRVMELTKNDATRIGLDWSILSAGGLVNLRVNQGLGDNPNTAGTVSIDGPRESVLATLDAVATNRNLIARPNLLALDGRETEVFVGDVIRYIEAIQSTQNGITVQTNEVRVGVRLAVLARAGADNNITMDLRPILSFLRGFTPTPAGGSLPQTSERISQSTAVLKSGETLALGGLIQDIDRNTVSGIPILKDLPIIGALFRRTDKSKDRTEIVFFLTARVVDETTRQDAARPKG
ncbi:MAG TPA: hypothetical protein VK934_02440 [Fimbriimonas sp.]|nr:hypothetical protein [Fimbriimonas sp.]